MIGESMKKFSIILCVICVQGIRGADLHSKAEETFYDYLMTTKKGLPFRLQLYENNLFIDAGSFEASFDADTVAQPQKDKKLFDFLHGDLEAFSDVYGIKGISSLSVAASKVGREAFQHVELKKGWYQVRYVYDEVAYRITYTIIKNRIFFSEIRLGSTRTK
jgi:hypothetical protein